MNNVDTVGPPWWCETCASWRHTMPCGRDECPTPTDRPPVTEQFQREGDPHEDDLCVQRIEIEFAIPIYLPPGALRELDGLLSSVVRMKMNQLQGHAHWVSGYGSKPLWSQADARFLGKTPADDAPASGEPSFDDSVYHIETSCIPRASR